MDVVSMLLYTVSNLLMDSMLRGYVATRISLVYSKDVLLSAWILCE